MTSVEVQELQAFYRRYPFDDESVFHMPSAQLTAMYYNAHRPAESQPLGPDDFLVFKPKTEEPAIDDDELEERIAAYFEALP